MALQSNIEPSTMPQTVSYKPEKIRQMINEIEKLGIEAGLQSTYFGDEVYAHIYGNNERALIMSVKQFMNWAPIYISKNH